MTHEEYAALVTRLEAVAATRPTAYRLRVGALAVLGYAYVAVVILLLLGLAVIVLWGLTAVSWAGAGLGIKLALPLIGLVLALVRALWVRIDPPQGSPLLRADAPLLFDEIDAVRRAAKAPPPHRVLITDDFNAAAAQVPRLGILGWPRNHLLLGLPLLTAVTPEQLRAVLAHEFGHLSRAHSRFGTWIYRVRVSWVQVLNVLEMRRSSLGRLLVNRFFGWYAPYFSAYSFVLARAHEYEADQTAAEVAGAAASASALAAMAIRTRFYDRTLWPRVVARAADEPLPPADAFAGVVRELPASIPVLTAREWLSAALREEASFDDTHPSLAMRLRALGVTEVDESMADSVAVPIDGHRTAAAHYLGPLAERLLYQLDAKWQSGAAAWWKDRHAHLGRAREGLRELSERATATPLSPEERFAHADWTEDVEGAEAALALVTSLVEDVPMHASGCFMLGRILIARGDDAGIEYLERGIALDPSVTTRASAMIASHLRRTGRGREAIAFQSRAEETAEEAARARAERQSIADTDAMVPPLLGDDARSRLAEQLAAYPQVRRAWMARKVTYHAPEEPFHVLGVERMERWWEYVADGSNQFLTGKLAAELDVPPGTLIFVITRKRKKLRRALKSVREAEVYRR